MSNSVNSQLKLFDAFDEASLYHPSADQHGFFSLLFSNGQKKTQRSYRLSAMAEVLSLVDYSRDTWMSQGEFVSPNRRIVNLARIGLLFVDLDTYKCPGVADLSVDQQVQRLHFLCAEANIPPPSLVVFSGRGLQAKWLLDRPLPRAALPRWNACQLALVDILSSMGSDRQARDASRVLRLVDSTHTGSSQKVHVVDVHGPFSEPVAYDFEMLAEALLPMTRAEWLDFMASEANRKAERKAKVEAKKAKFELVSDNLQAATFRGFNPRALAWARLEDLRKLGEIRNGWVNDNGVSSRTLALHWQLNFMALSGVILPGKFDVEANELARKIDPTWRFNASELGTLKNKAKDYVCGKKVEFAGRERPALYTPKNQHLIDLFGITDDEQRQLKTIISPSIATERDTLRQRAKRRAAGVQERSEYLSTVHERREKIQSLKAEGLSAAAIAKQLGVAVRTVWNALKE